MNKRMRQAYYKGMIDLGLWLIMMAYYEWIGYSIIMKILNT